MIWRFSGFSDLWAFVVAYLHISYMFGLLLG